MYNENSEEIVYISLFPYCIGKELRAEEIYSPYPKFVLKGVIKY